MKDTFRPTRLTPEASTRQGGTRSRSTSLEVGPLGNSEPSWPQDWAIDKPALRKAISRFNKGTEASRKLLNDPPSLGVSPQQTNTTSSHNSTTTTRQTSAEEAIYERPIGPEPDPSGSMANVTIDAAMQAAINAGMQAAINAGIAQYMRENPPQQGPSGPPGPPGPHGQAG